MSYFNIPCLGQPFHLGMVYDCCEEKSVFGLSLWNEDDIKNATVTRSHFSSRIEVYVTDSISERMKALGAEGNIKVSLLTGLAKTDGASKYVKHPPNQTDNARVVLHFKAVTKRKELVIDKLKEKSSISNTDAATHAVTAIEYGAEAFFIFDCEVAPTEKLEDLQQQLLKIVKSISLYGSNTKINYTIEDRIQCTFFGDFRPTVNPTTFHDAAVVHNELEGMFSSMATNDVPVRVWLWPLSKLSEGVLAIKEVFISSETERGLQNFVSNTGKLQAESEKIATSFLQFPQTQASIISFKEMVSEYNAKFMKKICSIIPLIRRGTVNENKVQQYFSENDASPFNFESLTEWLKQRQEEYTTLTQYILSLTKSAGKLD